jgi:hypothetical protein
MGQPKEGIVWLGKSCEFCRIKKILPLFVRINEMNKNDQLFFQLLYIFHTSAMQSLGKLKNPVTDKIERNLEQAKHSIELLEMLKDITRGNLTAESDKALNGFLTELRLNYVDEMNKDASTVTQ